MSFEGLMDDYFLHDTYLIWKWNVLKQISHTSTMWYRVLFLVGILGGIFFLAKARKKIPPRIPTWNKTRYHIVGYVIFAIYYYVLSYTFPNFSIYRGLALSLDTLALALAQVSSYIWFTLTPISLLLTDGYYSNFTSITKIESPTRWCGF